jgi:hypothetical protein
MGGQVFSSSFSGADVRTKMFGPEILVLYEVYVAQLLSEKKPANF